jgi:hypothetical protein
VNETTGATISRLGALTVMANNMAGTKVGPVDKAMLLAEINTILQGGAGPDAKKVQLRSMERCFAGTPVVVNGVLVYGGAN